MRDLNSNNNGTFVDKSTTIFGDDNYGTININNDSKQKNDFKIETEEVPLKKIIKEKIVEL